MKPYLKPVISETAKSFSLVPLAAGLSVGGAFAVGVAKGLSGDKTPGEKKLSSLQKCLPSDYVFSAS